MHRDNHQCYRQNDRLNQSFEGMKRKCSERGGDIAVVMHFVNQPEDRRLMDDAINQGVAISTIRRGTKLEKALTALAESLRVPAAAQARMS